MRRGSRRMRAAAALAIFLALAVVAFLVLTRPGERTTTLPEHEADPANGETMFWVGGCLGCHGPGLPGAAADLPSGGAAFPTPVGTFYPMNLTPDVETGIGGWSASDFVDAMTRGLSPDGRHYLPAFPYLAYRRMAPADVLDLRAYLMGLPAVRSPARSPEVPALGLVRRATGLWKRRAFASVTPGSASEPGRGEAGRGAYLVSGPGHCGECHTPRDALMTPDRRRHLAGGPHPGGEGQVPGLLDLVARGRYTDAADLALALRYGETFGYDKMSSGGMAVVQRNLSRLPEDELQAIAEYLVGLTSRKPPEE